MRTIEICEACGSKFVASEMSTKYCSQGCACVAQWRKQWGILLTESENTEMSPEQDLEETSIGKAILSIKDLQKLFGVSRASIYRYLQTDIIKSIRINGKIYVRMSDIDALFENAPAYQKRSYKKKGQK